MRTTLYLAVFLSSCLLSTNLLVAQQEPKAWEYRPTLMVPFWESEWVEEEPILFVRDPNSGEARGSLLFPIEEVRSVQSSSGDQTYEKGVDYRFEPGSREVVLPPGSRIRSVLPEELRRPPNSQRYRLTHRDGQGEILFGAKLEYHEMQTWITYKKKDRSWPSPSSEAPSSEGSKQGKLPGTLEKLRQGKPVTIVLLGDSISTGCNASGWGGGAPHQPPYQDLWLQHLQKVYTSEVRLINLAVGGMATPWGLTKTDEVMSHKPDLVLLAFGMNDAGSLSTEDYKKNTARMIEQCRAIDAQTEFILIATMLGNQDWTALRHERFPEYRDALADLSGEGIALADMTSIWKEMLARKPDSDLTGNGVNHPNDFGHRVYAQVLSQLLKTP